MVRLIRSLVLAMALFAGLAAAPALARNVTADLTVLSEVLKAKGHKVQIKTAGNETYVRVEDPGYYGYNIYLYGCDDAGKNCRSVQFFSAFSPAKNPTLTAMNQYSIDHRYAHAFLDSDGEPNLAWDLYLGEKGMSEGEFFANLDLWDAMTEVFGDFVFGKDGENDKPAK